MEIKGFEVKECIYKGNNSTIWKAHQISLSRSVALKVLNPELAADPEEKADFLREAKITAKIKHPNLVQVYDIGDEGNLCYYTMEYCGGPTLEQMIKEKKHLPDKMTMDIAVQVARALKCLWQEERIVHRNIKPDNILTTKDKTAKVCDFGLVKICSDGAEEDSDDVVGTPNYMSPELAAGKDIDFHSDMYSLGTLVYHMLTGQAPFDDRTDADAILEGQRKDQIANPKELVPNASVSILNLLTKLMMKSPDYRYKSWAEAIDSINKAKKGRLFLMQKKSQALSTIRDIQSSKPSTGTKKRSYERKISTLPLWLHTTLWLALILWWSGSAYVLMQGRMPASSEEEGGAFADIPMNAPENSEEESSAFDDFISGGDDSGDSTEEPDDETAVAGTEKDPAEAGNLEQPETATEPAVTPEIVTKVIEGKLAEAFSIINKKSEGANGEKKDQLETMGEAIKKLASVDSTVAEAFANKVGFDVTIHHMGKEIPVIINSVINKKISAKTAGENGREVTFPVSKLQPSEKARWLGRARSDADHAVRSFLYAMDGNTKEAARHAEASGPLSDPLRNFLASR